MNPEDVKILIVDDEPDICEIIRYNLWKEGYQTTIAHNGSDAIHTAKAFLPDLILLDIMMPEKDGIETLKDLRKHSKLKNTAIIFLTAMGGESSQIEGLNLGADDYIVKPIMPRLLLSRIQAVLRRTLQPDNDSASNTLNIGSLIIDRSRFIVYHHNQEVILAKKEFELLELLAMHPGRVFLRDEILNKVWGTEVIVGDRTIDVHVRKIRKKMQSNLIQTVKGVGYKLEIKE